LAASRTAGAEDREKSGGQSGSACAKRVDRQIARCQESAIQEFAAWENCDPSFRASQFRQTEKARFLIRLELFP
jgi:hypothetical protein